MKHSLTLWGKLTFVLTVLLAIAGFAAPMASAQGAPTEISFQVSSYTCDTDPGDVSVAAGNIPDTCTPDTGASFTVAADDGSFTASCTVEAGSCVLQVPNEAFVTVTEDVAPAGTAPRANPISTQAVTEFAGALFINLPTAAPPPEPPANITFRITKYTCDQDPGDVSPIAGNIPDYCSPTAGVIFEVTAEDGTVLGSCTTDATGLCALELPNEATVVVTEDTTTSPANTIPRQNPITTQVATEFAGAFFVNLPAPVEPQPTEPPPVAEPTQPPVQLPDTGTGPADTDSESGLFAAMLGMTITCGATAMLVRRRTAR